MSKATDFKKERKKKKKKKRRGKKEEKKRGLILLSATHSAKNFKSDMSYTLKPRKDATQGRVLERCFALALATLS